MTSAGAMGYLPHRLGTTVLLNTGVLTSSGEPFLVHFSGNNLKILVPKGRAVRNFSAAVF